ncbi:MAG: YdcH family protein [Myxococcales bacterium]|nr:YdcH family protein [Myxococcales bacterium]MCB9627603.1 YdcH family protein [Sandaracinaceae bacterium]
MSKSSLSSEKLEFQLERLTSKHQKIDARVCELDGRLSLTADEETELQQLKKEKLALKDELAGLTSR